MPQMQGVHSRQAQFCVLYRAMAKIDKLEAEIATMCSTAAGNRSNASMSQVLMSPLEQDDQQVRKCLLQRCTAFDSVLCMFLQGNHRCIA